jgi:homoserine kinase
MRNAVEHSRRLAAFVGGCATGNIDLIKAGFDDILVEPQRAHLLPAFRGEAGALQAGALGCSFSGSGPFGLRLGARGAG